MHAVNPIRPFLRQPRRPHAPPGHTIGGGNGGNDSDGDDSVKQDNDLIVNDQLVLSAPPLRSPSALPFAPPIAPPFTLPLLPSFATPIAPSFARPSSQPPPRARVPIAAEKEPAGRMPQFLKTPLKQL
mgnify:CR=1 FL=1